jgi:hypothetical protein
MLKSGMRKRQDLQDLTEVPDDLGALLAGLRLPLPDALAF